MNYKRFTKKELVNIVEELTMCGCPCDCKISERLVATWKNPPLRICFTCLKHFDFTNWYKNGTIKYIGIKLFVSPKCIKCGKNSGLTPEGVLSGSIICQECAMILEKEK